MPLGGELMSASTFNLQLKSDDGRRWRCPGDGDVSPHTLYPQHEIVGARLIVEGRGRHVMLDWVGMDASVTFGVASEVGSARFCFMCSVEGLRQCATPTLSPLHTSTLVFGTV